MNFEIQLERQNKIAELVKSEQFRCPVNLNHQLQSLDRQKCHLNTCKELKTRAAETIIYFCQFYEGHMYIEKKDRDSHETQCPWTNVPGNAPYDHNINRYSVIKGSCQKSSIIQNQNQLSHYQYAQKKGLIKQKKPLYNDELINAEDFIFIRDPLRIKLELEQKFKIFQQNLDDKQILALLDNREDTEIADSEFPLSNHLIEMIPLSQWLAQCFQLGLPFNEFFNLNYKISIDARNKYQQLLNQTQINSLSVGFHFFMPSKILEDLIEQYYPINNYDSYLTHLVSEVKVKMTEDKFQQEFIKCVYQVTQNHPKYRQPTCLLNIQRENEILVIVPKTNCKYLKDYASQQANLVLLSYKINSPAMLNMLNIYNPHQNLKLCVDSSQINTLWWKASTIQNSERIQHYSQQMQPMDDQNILNHTDITQQKLISDYMDEQKLLVGIEEIDRQIINYQQRITDKENTINQQKQKTYEARDQNSELLTKQQVLNSQQNNNDMVLKNEFKKLKKKIKSSQEQLFQGVLQQFEKYKLALQKDIREKVEDSKNIEQQKQNYQLSIQRKKDNLNKLQTRIDRKEKQIIILQEDISQVVIPNNYYDSGELNFDVSQNILCRSCAKNKINIVFLSCGHAMLCQTCFTEFFKQGLNYCFLCNKQFEKYRHILWEAGFQMGDQDLINH